MQTIKNILYSDIESFFGNPGDTTDFVKKVFPFKMYLNGNRNLPCVHFYGNKYIANSVIEAFEDILKEFGIDYIRENGLDEYGGCFMDRMSRGSTMKSVHAWGLAVDYMPSRGEMGEKPDIPKKVVEIFKKHGFLWGGDWSRPDGMHFTAIIE